MIENLLNTYYPEWINILNRYNVSYNDFIVALSAKSGKLEDKIRVSSTKSVKITTEIFHDRPPRYNIRRWLLNKADLKDCSICNTTKHISEFRNNNSKSDGKQSSCIVCHSKSTSETQAQRQAKYRAAKIDRTPIWADLEAIKQFYAKCPEGYHVDHEIPLQGVTVSGLHVLENLQYLTALENTTKNNKFEPESANH